MLSLHLSWFIALTGRGQRVRAGGKVIGGKDAGAVLGPADPLPRQSAGDCLTPIILLHAHLCDEQANGFSLYLDNEEPDLGGLNAKETSATVCGDKSAEGVCNLNSFSRLVVF